MVMAGELLYLFVCQPVVSPVKRGFRSTRRGVFRLLYTVVLKAAGSFLQNIAPAAAL